MNQLLLNPTDILFFRDGRPMSGSLAGHGAAWPLPHVTNAALHAALWRAGDVFNDTHTHSGSNNIDYKFGSLVTAGPFPVLLTKMAGGEEASEWLFPRPLDAGICKETQENEKETHEPTILPLDQTIDWGKNSSLPNPLKYAVANKYGPTKKTPSPWWNSVAWAHYLGTANREAKANATGTAPRFFKEDAFADTEFSYGIGMNPQTQTQDGNRFYSAHYLRLREGCQLGLLANDRDGDLIATLFPNSGARTPIIVGGQQRICSVVRTEPERLPLPAGLTGGFKKARIDNEDRWLVKWILLSPAIWPQITEGPSKRGRKSHNHPGGWLPNWICPGDGKVLLQIVDQAERKKRRKLNAAGEGYASSPNIEAHLTAAVVGKPIPVTGYALPHEATGARGGTKPTYLAVPAGSVYYFVCKSEKDATALAAALNWHGHDSYHSIKNRRSTLFGEKGFGIGVCGTWQFHDGRIPS